MRRRGTRSANKKRFEVGDIVRHTAKFRRSIGMYAGGPLNGIVVDHEQIGDIEYPRVQWSDREYAVPVHPANIELDPRARRRNKGVPREEKERRRAKAEREEKAKARRRKRRATGRRRNLRLPNAPVVPGDRVRILSEHPRTTTHRTGVVEDVVQNTVWVRLDHSQSLLGVDLDEIDLLEGSPVRRAVEELAQNPAEEIAAAAYAYTDALDRQVTAIRTGDRKRAAEAKQNAVMALRDLEQAAASRSWVSASVGAAIFAALGSVAGAPGAAVGGLLGSAIGTRLSRPFRGAQPMDRKEIAEAKRKAVEPSNALYAARPMPPSRPAAARPPPPPPVSEEVEVDVTPVSEVDVTPVSEEVEGLEGFEEFFEEPEQRAANRRVNKLKRRLL